MDKNVFSFKRHVYNWIKENKENKKPSSEFQQNQQALADHLEQGQHHHRSHPRKQRVIKQKLQMTELMGEP